jgi:hypothetical protein
MPRAVRLWPVDNSPTVQAAATYLDGVWDPPLLSAPDNKFYVSPGRGRKNRRSHNKLSTNSGGTPCHGRLGHPLPLGCRSAVGAWTAVLCLRWRGTLVSCSVGTPPRLARSAAATVLRLIADEAWQPGQDGGKAADLSGLQVRTPRHLALTKQRQILCDSLLQRPMRNSTTASVIDRIRDERGAGRPPIRLVHRNRF